MSDYNITITVKNGRILRLMSKNGYSSVNQMCTERGLSNKTHIGELINLKRTPFNKDGYWCYAAIKLSEALNCIPEDLFSEKQLTSFMKSNKAISDISDAEVDLVLSNMASHDLDHNILLSEMKYALHSAIGTLSERQKLVLTLRYGLDGDGEKTLEEIGQQFSVTRDRIRQIEAKALRMLKQPSRSQVLRKIMEDV